MPKRLKPETPREVDGSPRIRNARDHNSHHREIIAIEKFLVGRKGSGFSATLAAAISELKAITNDGLVRNHVGVVPTGEAIPMPEGIPSTTITGPLPTSATTMEVESTEGFPASGLVTKFNSVDAQSFGPAGAEVQDQLETGFSPTAAGSAIGFTTTNVGGAASHSIFGESDGDGIDPFILDSAGNTVTLGVRGLELSAGGVGFSSPTAGGVFATGSDPDFHAEVVTDNSSFLLQTAVDYVTFGKPSPSILLVTGVEDLGDGFRDPRIHVEIALGSGFDVADSGSGAPDTLDLRTLVLSSGGVLAYDVVIIASDFGGWLTQAEIDVLNDRTSDILSYVNDGGGLVVLAESRSAGFRVDNPETPSPKYGFLPFLKPANSRHVDVKVKDYDFGTSLENFELISYESKTETTFDGCTRAVAGTAQELEDGDIAAVISGRASLLLTHAFWGKTASSAARSSQFSDFVIARTAGTGSSGNTGDDAPALRATLSSPADVAIGSDVLYIADTGNHRVRRIGLSGLSAGLMEHFAGSTSGVAGTTGDDGLAAAALLDTPTGIAVDSDDNVYIADTGNHRIRKVDAVTGIITHFAGNGLPQYVGDGGPAIAAGLKSPRSVAFDSFGNLWIADTGNGAVRRVDSSGDISTPFSELTDRAKKPWRVAVSPAGDLYVSTAASASVPADSWRVFKATASTVENIIETLVGVGGSPVSVLAHSLKYDGADALYYIQENFLINKYVFSTMAVSTIAGISGAGAGFAGDGGPATAAQFNFPVAIGVGPGGDIFISDTLNHRIRKIDAGSGNIDTIAGNGTEGHGGNGGPASAATLFKPGAMYVTTTGDIYFHDGQRPTAYIRKIEGGTGIISDVVGNGMGSASAPDGSVAATSSFLGALAIHVDESTGDIFVLEDTPGANTATYLVRKVSGVDGKWTTILGGGFSNFKDMVVGPAGEIYVALRGSPALVTKTVSGVTTDFAGNGLNSQINTTPGEDGPALDAALGGIKPDQSLVGISSLAMGPANALHIVAGTYNIRRVIPGDSTIPSTISVLAGIGGVSTTTFVEGALATGAALNEPAGITVKATDVFVVLTAGNKVVEVNAFATAAPSVLGTAAGTGQAGLDGDDGEAILAELNGPDGIVADANTGRIYVADSQNNVIRVLIPFTPREIDIPDVPNQFFIEHDASLAVDAAMLKPSTPTAFAKYGSPVEVAYSMVVVGGADAANIDEILGD
jgi:hypothetical protein